MALGAERSQGAAAALQPLPLPGDFPDEFAEFQARASTGGTVFGLLRRASGQDQASVAALFESDDYKDCNFLMVSEPPRRGRSRSLGSAFGDAVSPGNIPKILSGSGSGSGSGESPPRTPGDGAEDSDTEQDNLLLCAYQGQPRRFSAACGDARDITAKHNIKVSISPAPSSKSISSTSRLGEDRHDDVDDDDRDLTWGLPVYRDFPPYRRTSEADIDRLRPPQWGDAQPEPEPTTYRRRSFSITPRGGIVNEGDFLVAKFGNTVVPASSVGSDLDQQGSRSRASSFNSQGSPALSAASSCDSPTYKVLVLGALGVGKTALTQQFMTSDFMGAQNTSFDAPHGAHYRTNRNHNGVECTVPVCIDGEDSFLEFTDLTDPENPEEWRQAAIDAFIVVYSVTDRASFQKAIDLLYNIRNSEGSDLAVILVANKTDLMRARIVAEQEGKSTAATYDIKYIEVSAALNHKVDDLLVGVVKQIRLNPERLKRRRKKKKPLKKRNSEENTTGCLRKARENVLLKILNRSVGKLSKSCENLMTL